jgi:type VI secretion system secreted protein VgrG
MSAEHPIRYFLDLPDLSLQARDVTGSEGISQPFRFELRFAAPPELPHPGALLRCEARVRLARDDWASDRALVGIVTDASIGAAIRGVPDVHLVIEPPLALARLRTDSRVLRNMSVPEIVCDVLSQIGISPELRLRDTYPKRPYCVQRRETDFDFISRLLEDEGIFYFFTSSGALVLGDSPAAYEPMAGLPGVPFRQGLGLDQNQETIYRISQRATVTPSKVTLRDFNPEHPSLDMQVSAPAPTPFGPEFYDYPGEYLTPQEGTRKAQRMSEAIACSATRTIGQSFCPRLAPGHTFALENAPPGIAEGHYVVVALSHAFHRDQAGFENRFEALDATVAYRPPRVTPEPRIDNPLTGVVTGPAGADIHTDPIGRVKVHFHWDRRLPLDDDCSDWIPVLQDNTGHSVAIPRVGWEVVVHFLEGDPDRPVVLGRVYNGADPFPEPLPAQKTRSALKSLSSPGRDGTNMIRFDDAGGSEQMFVHAEKDENIVVANDKREEVLSDETTMIAHDETITIGANHKADIGDDISTTVGGNQTWVVSGNRKRKVGAEESTSVTKDHSLRIGGMHFRRIGTDDAVQAQDLTERVGAVDVEASLKDNATSSGKNMSITVGGAFIEIARKSKSEAAKVARVETIGGVVLTKAKKAIAVKTKSRVTKVGGALKMTATGVLAIKGKNGLKAVAGTGTLQGTSNVTLEVRDSGNSVVIDGGVISITSSGTINIQVTGPNQLGAGIARQK